MKENFKISSKLSFTPNLIKQMMKSHSNFSLEITEESEGTMDIITDKKSSDHALDSKNNEKNVTKIETTEIQLNPILSLEQLIQESDHATQKLLSTPNLSSENKTKKDHDMVESESSDATIYMCCKTCQYKSLKIKQSCEIEKHHIIKILVKKNSCT
ncbi:hypothetical protein RF11_00138 [Thelohanellus kitauei]|uniref:Uncharacterized protein n=1 Tax=Thelohanellus kitauei TaxID=669202 RepID=A0A0C2MST3_THEKT|nr:hypothetical protein RF11_00138 [Thelohanellus kitauei]